VTFQHLGNLLNLTPELVEHVAALVIQRDLDEHQQRRAQLGRIHARVIAGDHAVALHPLDPLDTGGDRQPDLLREIFHGHPAVLLQEPQDLVVELVECADRLALCSHGVFAENSENTITKPA
jgi:hypothetical protein